MTATSISALRQSLFWQEHVAAETRDATQRKRCLAVVARLKSEIAALEPQIQDHQEHNRLQSRWFNANLSD